MKKLFIMVILFSLFATFGYSQIIHVPGDKGTIQEGINAAFDEDTVLVDPGVYYENVKFNGKAITLTSNFIFSGDTSDINNTVIDGSQPNHPDSASTVMFINGEDTSSIIMGFTITGGKGMDLPLYEWPGGGGIICIDAGAKILHNKITDNQVMDSVKAAGGGIACFSSSGVQWIIIHGNKIINNTINALAENAFGAGIYSQLNTVISNNLIENNACFSEGLVEGAGFMIEELTGSNILLSIHDNLIINNTLEGSEARGAGFNIWRAGVEITNNIISGNVNVTDIKSLGAGGLINESLGKVMILNNKFINNIAPIDISASAGGGLCVLLSIENLVKVDGNLFKDNRTKHGGGFYAKKSYNLLLTNNIFSGNETMLGGAIGLFYPATSSFSNNVLEMHYPQIINNTFYNNSALTEGGAIRFGCAETIPIVFNCIFRENEGLYGKDICNMVSDEMLVAYSDIDTAAIDGSWSGYENINEDPLFIDDTCHLNCLSSPCINTGIEMIEMNGVMFLAPDFDFDGELRPKDGKMDIGAIEQKLCTGINDPQFQISNFNLQTYPNPTFGISDIRYQISDIRFVTLEVFDIHGRIVRTLVSEEQKPGDNVVGFNGFDLPGGIYFVRLSVGAVSETTKLILMK